MASAGEDSHGGKALTNAEIRKYFTDPQQAGEFARATGVDALAVCFGTVHGIYAKEPVLDLERVKAIRAAMPADCRIVCAQNAAGGHCRGLFQNQLLFLYGQSHHQTCAGQNCRNKRYHSFP